MHILWPRMAGWHFWKTILRRKPLRRAELCAWGGSLQCCTHQPPHSPTSLHGNELSPFPLALAMSCLLMYVRLDQDTEWHRVGGQWRLVEWMNNWLQYQCKKRDYIFPAFSTEQGHIDGSREVKHKIRECFWIEGRSSDSWQTLRVRQAYAWTYL